MWKSRADVAHKPLKQNAMTATTTGLGADVMASVVAGGDDDMPAAYNLHAR